MNPKAKTASVAAIFVVLLVVGILIGRASVADSKNAPVVGVDPGSAVDPPPTNTDPPYADQDRPRGERRRPVRDPAVDAEADERSAAHDAENGGAPRILPPTGKEADRPPRSVRGPRGGADDVAADDDKKEADKKPGGATGAVDA